ncbi:MAG: acyl-CoA dehydratase activase [Desulfovibrio sp.]|jgi:predicted CoA-substrate-specific enzyme activase|nr:acyl-CoA dehydratase activase [Desulfovibrio sp.]
MEQSMGRNPEAGGHGVILGLDIGSVSVKAAVLDASGRVGFTRYQRHQGRPDAVVHSLLCEVEKTYDVSAAAVAGMGAERVAPILNACAVNEVTACVAAASLYPCVQSIIDIGGQDSKYILLDSPAGIPQLADFAMSSACASGTGSFLEQQARRLRLNIEGEFGETAVRSQTPARIAGRCSVFAKSDMIHLQQKGIPLEDIVAGLCFALARSFKAGIMGNRPLQAPVAFVGGVAANIGVVRAFGEVLQLTPGPLTDGTGGEALFVPPLFPVFGAVGAALFLRRGNAEAGTYPGAEHFSKSCSTSLPKVNRLEPLFSREGDDAGMERENPEADADSITAIRCSPLNGDDAGLYLGIDIGSISTNIVLMTASREVAAKYYLMTASRPIEAVRQGFRHILEYYGPKIRIRAVGVTGSGRHLIGDLVGADVVVNEITAHARAATFIRPDVDTVFEIGGQDSKYIRIEKGLVKDFTMNKACAAGTGSFLEEQAEKLGIRIKRDFASLALASRQPVDCGEQCTVFIDTEVVRCRQQGVCAEDVAGGLAYSIVANYLHKVVEKRPVGEVILFQGGVAHNKAVVAAFASRMGKGVIVPEHNDVMGALGCCLLAMERESGESGFAASFRGFDVLERGYQQKSFQCGECPNHCEVSKILVQGHAPLFYGGRCERFEVGRGKDSGDLEDLFAQRQQLFTDSCGLRRNDAAKGVIGYPRMMTFYEYAPFFCVFFRELGFNILFSPHTNAEIIRLGQTYAPGQMCFPTKVAYGHASWMKTAARDGLVNHIFIPSVRETAPTSKAHEYANHCSYIQFAADLADEAFHLRSEGLSLLSPALHFRLGKKHVLGELTRTAHALGLHDSGKIARACAAAYAAQANFGEVRLALGGKVLERLKAGTKAAVLVGKAHNIHDPGTNMQLGRIFRRLGMQLIPVDLFDLFNSPEVGKAWRNMTLAMGQRSLAAADIIRKDPRLHAVYLTNFGCVNDSVYPHFFSREMGGKPYLLLEIDEHSAEAGIVTRCEAFADSLRGGEAPGGYSPARPRRKTYDVAGGRTLYLPHAANGMLVWAAALRAHGINARVLPPPGDESLAWGRKCLDGKECLPCTLMTGDMLSLLKGGKAVPAESAFFMPGSCGSCRYDLFNTLQLVIFEDNGLGDAVLIDEYRGENEKLHAVMSGGACALLTWRGLVAADILEKLRLRVRPYETKAGATDAVYFDCLNRLADIVENRGDVERAVAAMVEAFEAVPVNGDCLRPVVGLVGEAYLRNVDYASRDLIGKIEAMGGEVRMPAIMEVLWYSLYKQWYFKKLGYKHFQSLLHKFQLRFLHHMEKALRKRSARLLAHPYEKPVWEVIGQSGLNLDAGLGFGAAVDMASRDVSGIVHAIPFNCVPGAVIYGLESRFRSLFPHIPFMTVICSGNEDAGVNIRLEAFLLQCLYSGEKKTDIKVPA